MTFGQYIKQARMGMQLTQRELASRIGIDFTYISKLENGKNAALSEDKIIKMSQVLNLDTVEVLLAAGQISSWFAELIQSEPLAYKFLLRYKHLSDEQKDEIRKIIAEK